MRGSPAAMSNFTAVQPPDLFGQMNAGGVRGPPSSNPVFNGQFNPQMQQMRPDVAGRMPNGNWQGPPGQLPMNQQASMQQQQQPGQQQPQQPQPNQHPQLGTPQQRNAMPPPQAPPAGATNGRNGGDDAPPTPSQTNKANPKAKKDSKKVSSLHVTPSCRYSSHLSLKERARERKHQTVWLQLQLQKRITLLQLPRPPHLSHRHIPIPSIRKNLPRQHQIRQMAMPMSKCRYRNKISVHNNSTRMVEMKM